MAALVCAAGSACCGGGAAAAAGAGAFFPNREPKMDMSPLGTFVTVKGAAAILSQSKRVPIPMVCAGHAGIFSKTAI